MSEQKHSKNDSAPEEESQLYKDLKDLHNHIDQSDVIDSLIKELEGIPQITNVKSIDFCKSYIILVIDKYIEDRNEREMLLASYGLLKGLEFKPGKLYRRMRIYRDNAQDYNAFCKNTLELENDSFSTTYRNELRRITIKLEEKLINAKNENNGKLGLIDKVPATLELPEPIYTSERLIRPEEDLENITFEYDPKKGTHKISVPKSIAPEKLRIICEYFAVVTTGAGLLAFIVMLIGYINSNVKPNRVYEDNRIYNIREEKDGGKWIEAEPQVSEYVKTNDPTVNENKIYNIDSDKDFKSLF